VPVYITPLLELDTEAEYTPTSELVAFLQLNVGATATTKDQAVEVLTALGLPEEVAEAHVRYCTTGEWQQEGQHR
jgi:hypothetical protein